MVNVLGDICCVIKTLSILKKMSDSYHKHECDGGIMGFFFVF